MKKLIRTKIICTMGPSVARPDMIRALIKAGMNVARINFSHGDYEEHQKVIKMLKEAREELQCPLAIMLDTKGPEVRIGPLKEEPLYFRAGDRWRLVKEKIRGHQDAVSVLPPEMIDQIPIDQEVLLNDGNLTTRCVERGDDYVVVQMMHQGSITSRKGINLPGIKLKLPLVTETDERDIRFGLKLGVDAIAASFVCEAETILQMREILRQEKAEDTLLIAKIENVSGIDHFDTILQVSDGIMIARGDLGVEVPFADVPSLQKMMIKKAYLQGKISITATQMLESMIQNRRPTRAEVSDVANAIYDSTSCVMLSGETAVGNFPVETVETMRSVIVKAEEDFDYHAVFTQHNSLIYTDVPASLTLAAVKTAYSADASAIAAFTNSGSTARLLSRLRPKMPIFAMTPKLKAYHNLSLVWGVVPFQTKKASNIEDAMKQMNQLFSKEELLEHGDLIVITGGTPFGVSGTTNMMVVDCIGDVLTRGSKGVGPRVHGKALVVMNPESIQPFKASGAILVIPKANESFLPLIHMCKGVILDNQPDDKESLDFLEEAVKKRNISSIFSCQGALTTITSGLLITIAPKKMIVFKGVQLNGQETENGG